MKRPRIILIFSSLVLLGAGVLGGRARVARFEAERAAAGLAQARALQLKRIGANEVRIAVARGRADEAEKALARAAAKPAAISGPATPKTSRRTPSTNELIHSDPKLEALYLQMSRGVMTRSLTPYFRRLGLAESQIRSLLDAYDVSQVKRFDLDAIEGQQDVAGRETIARLKKEARDQLTAEQRRILGPEGYAALVAHQAASTLQSQVTSFAGAAAVQGMPLSLEQGEALTRAFVAASRQNAGEGRKQPIIDWLAIDGAARTILTPEQFVLFQTTGVSFYNSRWGQPLDSAILQAKRTDAAAKAEPPRG